MRSDRNRVGDGFVLRQSLTDWEMRSDRNSKAKMASTCRSLTDWEMRSGKTISIYSKEDHSNLQRPLGVKHGVFEPLNDLRCLHDVRR